MSTYFKAKSDFFDYKSEYSLLKDELLTPRERYTQAANIPDLLFDIVEISRKKTYKFFGARFEIKGQN